MRLLDLFCGAGGAAMGYHRAGFDEIVGIDHVPKPDYPFAFIEADALDWLRDAAGADYLHNFDLIHASPPCQRFSAMNNHDRWAYPDLIPATRDLLIASGVPYVIENVPRAPLLNPIQICGTGLGMDRIQRHRIFECSFPVWSTPCNHSILREPLSVVGHGESGYKYKQGRVLPHNLAARQAAMGIDWMHDREDLSEAIPPSFTEYIGRAFLG